MKRSIRCLLAVAPLLLGSLAEAKDLPNYNAYATAKPVKVATGPRLAAAPPAFVSSTDDRRGVPTFLWAARPTASSAATLAGLSPEAAARRHLQHHAARYGLSPAAIATARVQQIHDLGHGGIIVVLRQAPTGVEVFHNDVKVLMDRQLDLVAIGGNLHASAVAAPKSAGFVLSEQLAIVAAFKDLYGISIAPGDLRDTKKIKAGYHYYDLGKSPVLNGTLLRFVTPARVKRVWYPLPDRLVPAYFVEMLSGRVGQVTPEAYNYVIAADDGRMLYRNDLTHRDTFNYRVFADGTGDHRPMDGPIADYTPYPGNTPNGSYPAYVTPNLISIDGFNKFHDPWLPAGATVSTGNNVDAYTDDDKPDGFSGGSDIRATTTAANTFDRTYDTSQGPQSNDEQRMAAITDLFYVNNWLHDWWYDSGFDEAAGNAQQDNLGRGGVAGDPLHAEAQDGAPTQRDNSNMSAMADGESPRMQMFVWDGPIATSLTLQPSNQGYTNNVAEFGPQAFNTSGSLVLANDGTAPVTDACEAIQNNVTGKIVLVDRGTCSFKQKAVNVQAAGGIGMVLADNKANEAAPFLGDDPSTNGNVTIPILSVSLTDGNAIKTALMNGAITVAMNRSTSVDRDGTIDNSVVAHEWGHYIHLRQVDCASQACGAESEGWGDFNALLMVVRQGDNLDGTFALAQYATASFPDDPAYFGIRRYPYSVDMSKNPLTFKLIGDDQTLPTTAPVAASTAQGPNSEVHDAGEVWAAMLFESLVALLKQSQGATPPYTFDEARRRMSDYVEGGLKMAPTDPTYTEQRDAILAAAAAADPNDLQILAQAFARRGAGTCAVSPPRDSQDLTGVVEDFTVQPSLSIVSVGIDDSVKSCDQDGQLDAEETGKVTVKVMNAGTAAVTSATAVVSSTTAGVSFPSGATATFGAIPPFGTATATVDIALAASVTKMEVADLKVQLQGAMGCNGAAELDTAPLVNFDELPMAAKTDGFESKASVWAITGDSADQIWARTEITPGNHVWTGADYSSPSDTALESPALTVSTTDKLVLTFDHRYAFESSMGTNWDGAVIEVSPDGGATWNDISMYGDPGYDGVLGDPMNQAMNVLKDRQGFAGTSTGYPALHTTKVDMGTSLAGKTIKVRFRIGSDDAQGEAGWDIDNVQFDGITNTPFPSLVDDKGTCGTVVGTGGAGGNGAGGGMATGGSNMGTGGIDGTGGGGPTVAGNGGCDCSTTGGPGSNAGAAASLLALAGIIARRRRSAKR